MNKAGCIVEIIKEELKTRQKELSILGEKSPSGDYINYLIKKNRLVAQQIELNSLLIKIKEL